MRASLDYIKEKFQEFNELCFEGKLQPLPFRLSSARTFLGQVAFMRKRNPNGTWHYSNFVFRISTVIDRPEREVEDTILHEMIHYCILSNQMQDTSAHGEIFKRMMKDINARFNRHITVTHKTTKEEQDSDTRLRQHIICVIRFRNNQRGITIAAKSRLFEFWNQIPRLPNVAECNWYVSTDPYFNRYPRAVSLKYYPISPAELEEHLKGAQPLIKTGRTIRVQRT